MKWVLIVVGSLVVLGLVLVLVGALLPRAHRAASELTLQQPIDTVWATVRALGDAPAWWPDIKSARASDTGGRETWTQVTTDGFTLPLIIEEESPPRLLVTRIGDLPRAPFGGTWRYELEPAPGGTRVRITEDGWVGPAFFRVMARLMGHHRTMDRFLAALAKKFGDAATPTHVSGS